MRVENFGCLLINNTRSRAYIQKLLAHSFEPQFVILVDLEKSPEAGQDEAEREPTLADRIVSAYAGRKYFLYTPGPNAILPVTKKEPKDFASFDPKKSIRESLEEGNISFETVTAKSLNDPPVVMAVSACAPKYLLFSGGSILRKEILSKGKKFIHIHPGYVPDIKGSMAIEWSILISGRCAASAFFMVERIDEGEILARSYFDPPGLEHSNIPALYSSHIRSEVLIDVIRNYVDTGSFQGEPQVPSQGNTYFKMHPVLNNIVFFESSKHENWKRKTAKQESR